MEITQQVKFRAVKGKEEEELVAFGHIKNGRFSMTTINDTFTRCFNEELAMTLSPIRKYFVGLYALLGALRTSNVISSSFVIDESREFNLKSFVIEVRHTTTVRVDD